MAKQLETIAAGVGGDMALFSLFSRARDAAGQRCVLLVDELRKKIHLGTAPDPTRPDLRSEHSVQYSFVNCVFRAAACDPSLYVRLHVDV